MSLFSERNNLKKVKKDNTNAPDEFRRRVVEILLRLGEDLVARVVAELTHDVEKKNEHWEDFWWENRQKASNYVTKYALSKGTLWYEFYDLIEKALEIDPTTRSFHSEEAERLINKLFDEYELPFHLQEWIVVYRGHGNFEQVIRSTVTSLQEANRLTAKQEMEEAIQDLSRRPNPDISGAIQHSMAALECVLRTDTGDKATLGELLKKNPNLIPKPLDDCIQKAWGYASERGRHLHEGRNPNYQEAELIVHLCAVIINYLNQKNILESK